MGSSPVIRDYVRPVQVLFIPTSLDFFGVRLYYLGGSHSQIDVSNVDGSQTLTVVGHEAIGGLTDGQMVYVTNVGSGTFQLKNSGGGIIPLTSCLIGTCSQGTHSLVFEGLSTTVAGTGTQRLVLDITGTSGGGKLIGIGGPGALVGKIGDQIVGATSTGLSIGAIDVHDAEADVTSAPTVRTTICGTGGGTDCSGVTTGSILRARDIHVTSATNANAATTASTEGGGLISLGSSEANATVTNDATTTIGAGAALTSTRDVTVLATTIEKLGVEATEAGLGLAAGADANPNAFTSHHTNVVVDGTIDAVRTVLAEARDGFVGIVTGRADGAGIGADSEANDNDRDNGSGGQGLHIGTHGQTQAVSQTSVGGTIKAQLIFLAGNVGRADTINANGTVGIDPSVVIPGCQSGTSFCLNAITFASSHATALGADSDATAIVDLNDIATVHLGATANLVGDSIELTHVTTTSTSRPTRTRVAHAAAATPTRRRASTRRATRRYPRTLNSESEDLGAPRRHVPGSEPGDPRPQQRRRLPR